jgi:hypothetical protein
VSKGSFDGIMLEYKRHGDAVEDGEGALLKRIRAIDAKTPIAVSLDMHANLYDDIVDNATVIAGYRTYPHVDMYESGALAGSILLRTIRGEVNPVMAWGNVPMLPHVMKQGTFENPNKALQARCAAMQQEGVLAASLHRLPTCGRPQCRPQRRSSRMATRRSPRLRDELWARPGASADFIFRIEKVPIRGTPRSSATVGQGPDHPTRPL